MTDVIAYADVRESVAVARSHGEKFFEQIVWQVENEAWKILGYSDWEAMREAEYGDLGITVPRADRPELTTRLRVRGLDQRQIAKTLGVGLATVNRDLQAANDVFQTEHVIPETRLDSKGRVQPMSRVKPEPVDDPPPFDPETGEVLDDPLPPASATAKPNNDADLINDIRLYLRAMASSREIARLSPAGKQHIIDALTETIEQIRS